MSRSGNALPNVLRTDVLERPENQRLETDLIYPVAFSQNSVRFVFPRKGCLDSNSQFKFRMTAGKSDGTAMGAGEYLFLPTLTGAPAAVARAFLEIGGRRVATLQDVGHFLSWKRAHYSNEYREGIAKPKMGGDDVFLGSGSAAYPPQAPFGQVGRPSNPMAQTATASEAFTASNAILKETSQLTPEWVLSLSQLIPMLKGVILPLFAIRQEVSLTIEFQADELNHRFQRSQTLVTAGTACSSQIVQAETYIMADFLFYPELLAGLGEQINSQGGYDLVYDEIQVAYNNDKAPVAGWNVGDTVRVETFLPLGGKRVKSVVQQSQLGTSADEGDVLAGIYNSRDCLSSTETMNLTIDSKPFYSVPIKNGSLMFSETNQVQGVPLQISDINYTFYTEQGASQAPLTGGTNVEGITDRTFNGLDQQEAGLLHWLGIKIANASNEGVRMSNTPMIWSRVRTVNAGELITNYTLRYFITTERVLNISNGIVNMIE
tara:strand:+ start:13094 stop:14563 length:1470 start_codon:yes stop_codon:yes gene_type:complete